MKCAICGQEATGNCLKCSESLCNLHRTDNALMTSLVPGFRIWQANQNTPPPDGLCPKCIQHSSRLLVSDRDEVAHLYRSIRNPSWRRDFPGEQVTHVAISPDGNRIAALTCQRTLRLYSSSGDLIKQMDEVHCISRYNTRHLAIATKDWDRFKRIIFLLDYDGEPCRTIDVGPPLMGGLNDLWLAPDSRFVAAALDFPGNYSIADHDQEPRELRTRAEIQASSGDYVWAHERRPVLEGTWGVGLVWDQEGNVVLRQEMALPVVAIQGLMYEGGGIVALLSGWIHRVTFLAIYPPVAPRLPNRVKMLRLWEDGRSETIGEHRFSADYSSELVNLDLYCGDQRQDGFVLAGSGEELLVLDMEGKLMRRITEHTYRSAVRSTTGLARRESYPIASSEAAVLRPCATIVTPLCAEGSTGAAAVALHDASGEALGTVEGFGPFHWLRCGIGGAHPLVLVKTASALSSATPHASKDNRAYFAIAKPADHSGLSHPSSFLSHVLVMQYRPSELPEHGARRPLDLKGWRPEWFAHVEGVSVSGRCIALTPDGRNLAVGSDTAQVSLAADGRLEFFEAVRGSSA